MTKKLTIHLPRALFEQAQKFAKDEGDSVSELVARAIRYEMQRMANRKHEGMRR